MSTDTTSTSRGASSAVVTQLEKLQQSRFWQGIVFGLVLIGIGLILQEGVIAGMLGIYGATAIALSVIGRVAVIRLQRMD